MDDTLDDEEFVTSFEGKPFSTFFVQPKSCGERTWRIRGSGVHGSPDEAPTTSMVLAVCEGLEIPVEVFWSTSPVSASAYPIEGHFLDGGIEGKTGNYLCEERGVTVTGPMAVLLLALAIGLKVRSSWRTKYGLEGVTLDDLIDELIKEAKNRPKREPEYRGPGAYLSGPY